MCYRVESDRIKLRKMCCSLCYFDGLVTMKLELERCHDKIIDRLKNSEEF